MDLPSVTFFQYQIFCTTLQGTLPLDPPLYVVQWVGLLSGSSAWKLGETEKLQSYLQHVYNLALHELRRGLWEEDSIWC